MLKKIFKSKFFWNTSHLKSFFSSTVIHPEDINIFVAYFGKKIKKIKSMLCSKNAKMS